ncbi:exosporium protein ExsC, partial [Bacillus cereus]|nr:exosporium protein ExsC [Bacillus cereus]
MTHIIDYQATQPISKTGETTFAIPASPNKAILANLKLRISSRDSRNNRVELIATV